jgi:hypothetical protein
VSSTIDDGLDFGGYPQPPSVPPDPTGEDWRGPPGPPGPPGPGLTLSNVIPPMDGVGAPGLASTAARGDHQHPADTSLMPLSPSPVTATGSTTPRSLQDRAADVINVKDYGATGNGTTLDTAAIQAAAAAIPANGAVLYFPRGQYLLSGSVPLRSNTTVRGQHGASVVVAAPAAQWTSTDSDTAATGAIGRVFKNIGNVGGNTPPSPHDTNIVIEDMAFLFPRDHPNYGGGFCHIIQFFGADNVTVRNCISDGGADLVAFVDCLTTLAENNVATNVSNCAIDHWNGTCNSRAIGNYITTLPTAGGGCGGIFWTGMDISGSNPALTLGFVCVGNQIVVNHPSGQAIDLNSTNAGPAASRIIIANNNIFVNGVDSYGILAIGAEEHGIIEGNYLEGGNGASCAIGVATPATYWSIANNRINNWTAGANGIIQVTGSACSVHDNHAIGSSSPLVNMAAGNISYGNSTGLGRLPVDVGMTFGSVFAASSQDLTKHLDLYGGIVGVGVSSGRMNLVTPSGAYSAFVTNGVDILLVEGAIVVSSVPVAAVSFQTGGTSGPTWTAGNGLPSGTHTRGSLYSRLDGPVGGTLYVSAGGTVWNAVAGV